MGSLGLGTFGKSLGSGMDAMPFTWLTLMIAPGRILPWLLLRGGCEPRTRVLHLLRSSTGLAGFFRFTIAARLVNLVNANVLLNTTPPFIPLLGLVVLSQQVPRTLWGCLGIGFAGMVMVVQPNASLLTRTGDLLGLAAGLLCAVEFVAMLAPGWAAANGGSPLLGLDPAQWWTVLASGVRLACFQFLLIKAYTYAEPGAIGAFQYSSVVFATVVFATVVFAGLIGWIRVAEQPTPPVWIGMALITLGGVLSIVLQRPAAASAAPAEGRS